jgi:hypothetical protein
MLRQHTPAEWVDLAERNGLHSGPLQAETEATYAAE